MEVLDHEQIKQAFEHEKRPPVVPNLANVDWGVLDYFGWIHPAGHQGYVVVPLANDEIRGLVLRRSIASVRKPRFEMCSWCNHVHQSSGTAMFSALVRGSDERKTVGNLMCRNLDCSLRIRNLCSDPPSYMGETIDLGDKVSRLQNSLYRFLHRSNALYTMES